MPQIPMSFAIMVCVVLLSACGVSVSTEARTPAPSALAAEVALASTPAARASVAAVAASAAPTATVTAHASQAPSAASVATPVPSASDGVSSDGTASLFDGRVTFEVPPDFHELSEDEINLKFPRGEAPKYVYANDTLGVSIAVTTRSVALAPDQLAEFKPFMEQAFEQAIPGLEWQTRDFVTINGREWIHLELQSDAIDTQIYNDVYVTSFKNQPLIFNFNSVVRDQQEVKSLLYASRDSILIQD